jgi:hypothetical protein
MWVRGAEMSKWMYLVNEIYICINIFLYFQTTMPLKYRRVTWQRTCCFEKEAVVSFPRQMERIMR